MRNIVCAGMALLVCTTSATAAEWSQFRGSRGDGISVEKSLPTKWSQKDGVDWATNLKGRANSSPAITAKHVHLTSQMEDGSLWVITLDRKSGQPVSEVRVGQGKLEAAGPANLYAHRHNAATPSPAAEGNHVWAFFGSGLLVCVDVSSGKIVWQKDMVQQFGDYDITFGMGASPRLAGDRLYVTCMTKGPSYVVALNKSNGDVVWKKDRKLKAADDGPDAYSSPAVLSLAGHESLVVAGSDHVNAYDLKSGRQLWVTDGLSVKSPYGRVIASPTSSGDTVVATSANPGGAGLGHILALRVEKDGTNLHAKEVWKYNKSTPDSSSPICFGGRVYTLSDKGIGTCLDIKTGDVHWQKRLGPGPFHASLVAGDGKVYYLNTKGDCVVVAAGDDGEVLATNKLEGTFYATPAISDGTLYLRAYERIYAVSGK